MNAGVAANVAFALALASGLSWGVADYFGGVLARRCGALVLALSSQALSGVLLFALVATLDSDPRPQALAWGAAGGVAGGIGLLAFYRALAIGPMSVVAPVSACAVAMPIAWGLVRGETPGAVALAGIALAVTGIVLVSRPADEDETVTGEHVRVGGPAIALALGAAVCFGTFFIALDGGSAGGSDQPLWTVAAARVGSLAALATVSIAALAARRRPLAGARPARALLVGIATVGVLDVLANTLFAFASTGGELAVVAVLGALYPAATVLLARVLLRERLSAAQNLGVALALAGVALMAAG